MPDGQFVHVYIGRGGANLENAGYLETADALRLTAAGAPKLTADPVTGAEVLICQTELPAAGSQNAPDFGASDTCVVRDHLVARCYGSVRCVPPGRGASEGGLVHPGPRLTVR